MVRIAPVRLSFNPKTLWFDAAGIEVAVGDAVVVSTARGHEFGHVAQAPFEMEYEQTKKLRSPLKPVVRLATDDDVAHADELADLSMQALPIFKQMANTYAPDMHPIAVEYLFGGEKAVFYFDSEERIDFRDLVRKLAAELQVRVDMKQIGVRDGARMVGGIGHCGQELCCARLGGDFNPVSIRMAKEQDLSLNPQKISGLCGRLMCCLRYEFDAYKDFHGRAPKKNARIETPDGEGKVVDLDVPREVVSIKVGDEKPVKVPLADMDEPAEGKRPTSVGEEAWERANAPAATAMTESLNLFTTQLSGDGKLAEPGKVTRMPKDGSSSSSRRRRRRGGSGRSGSGSGSGSAGSGEASQGQEQRKQRRRRSTTVSSDGSTKVTAAAETKKDDGQKKPSSSSSSSSSRRRRRRGGSGNKPAQQGQQGQQGQQQQGKSTQVGRNSSALRASRPEQGEGANGRSGGGNESGAGTGSGSGQKRRRRRSHKAGSSGEAKPTE